MLVARRTAAVAAARIRSARSLSSAAAASGKDRLVIFDTTLRDGEQSPGATLNTSEKIQIARQLSRMGVDVCEAGFPNRLAGGL